MENKENTAPGATNTESGKPNESEHSVPDLAEKVKLSKAMGAAPFHSTGSIPFIPPLDLRTEMFMLNQLKATLEKQYSMTGEKRYEIFSGVFEGCVEANGI